MMAWKRAGGWAACTVHAGERMPCRRRLSATKMWVGEEICVKLETPRLHPDVACCRRVAAAKRLSRPPPNQCACTGTTDEVITMIHETASSMYSRIILTLVAASVCCCVLVLVRCTSMALRHGIKSGQRLCAPRVVSLRSSLFCLRYGLLC